MEADLAFRGVDLRDIYRRGSGLTPRRLMVLIRGLPGDSWTHALLALDEEKAKIPHADKIRERQELYATGGPR